MAPKTLLAQWRKELTICGLRHCTHELSPTAGQNERSVPSAPSITAASLLCFFWLNSQGCVEFAFGWAISRRLLLFCLLIFHRAGSMLLQS